MVNRAVFKVIGSIISVAMFTPGPVDKEEHRTVVQIGVGLSILESDSVSGDKPSVHLYDVIGRSIGSTGKTKHSEMPDDTSMDVSVPFDFGGRTRQTEYLSIVNGGKDALCIAYIRVWQPDGNDVAWFGDIAKSCGADWYHSQRGLGDDHYQPACIWIDRDRSNGIRFQGLGMHIHDFAATQERAEQYNENHDLMCKAAPRLRMYTDMNDQDPIPFFNPPLRYNGTGLVDEDPAIVMDKLRWCIPKEGPNI